MLELMRHVIVVGPDRCYKTSMVRDLKRFYVNPTFKGARGDDAEIEKMVRSDTRYIFDRGLVCDRVYNTYWKRVVPVEMKMAKEMAEHATRMSGALYIHMSRYDFDGVVDDKHPDIDLQDLSNIYDDVLTKEDFDENPRLDICVDKVTTADLTNDPHWVKTVAAALDFLSPYTRDVK